MPPCDVRRARGLNLKWQMCEIWVDCSHAGFRKNVLIPSHSIRCVRFVTGFLDKKELADRCVR